MHILRSSRLQVFYKIGYICKFHRKTPVLEHLFHKVAGRRPSIHRCFPMNLESFLRLSSLTLSWRRPLSYRNQSIDLLRKSMGWFLLDNDLRHERVKAQVWVTASGML